MAFQNVTFPVNIARGAQGGPLWRTDISGSASGREKRNSPWSNGRHNYTVSVAPNEHQNRETLIAFFHARRGRLYSFRFKDFSDFKTSTFDASVSGTDQSLGTGDGATVAFQLVKRYESSGPTPYVRNITKPKSGTVIVALDGVAQTEGGGADYTIDYSTGVVTFAAAPANGVAVTAGFEFDVPVRFEEDELPATFLEEDISEFTSVSLIEVNE